MDKEAAKKLGQQLIATGRELIEQHSDDLERFETEYDIPNFYKHWRWKAYKYPDDTSCWGSWFFKGCATDEPSRKLREDLENEKTGVVAIEKSSWFLFRRSMTQRHNAYVIDIGSRGIILNMSEEDAIKFAKLPEMKIENREEVEKLQDALQVLERESLPF